MQEKRFGPVVSAGILIGLGLGGFIDSIVFRQILHAHAMLSTKVPLKSVANLRSSLLVEGIVGLCLLVCIVWGVVLLFRSAKTLDIAWSGQLLFGGWFLGWGAYTVIEGLVAHQLLKLHHLLENANPATQETGDWAYLIAGVLLAVFGYWAVASTRSELENQERDALRAQRRAKEVKGDRKVYLD